MQIEIIENAISPALVRAAEAAWPAPDWQYWHRYQGATADKFATMDRCRIPAACLAALDALALSVADKIGDSFIDYDLHGAGLHLSLAGGYLAEHVDAARHPMRPWRRTHSIVLCASSGWREEYGGQLVINCHGVLTPQFCTAVIFETNGVVHQVLPVSKSSPISRKTLALFAWETSGDDVGHTSAKFLCKDSK